MGFLSFRVIPRAKEFWAHVAQLAEHVLGKDEVIGSIPIMGSIRFALTVKQKN